MASKTLTNKPLRHQRRLFRWAIVADSLLVTALIVNYFRFELFGIVPGYAPHNFSFNITFFIPAVLTSALISIFVTVTVLLAWRSLPSLRVKLITVLMTIPIPILLLIQIIRILRVN
jgi:hypothetical protein